MAIKNSVYVYIDGINRTPSAVLPLKTGNFLDERLDECRLSLRAIKKKNFAPLTPVEIIINNEFYLGTRESRRTIKKRTQTKHFIVANDNATETQIGSGLYNHELYLIEVTKIAECVVGDTLTFTNDLGRSYTKNNSFAVPFLESSSNSNDGYITEFNNEAYLAKHALDSKIILKPILKIATELQQAKYTIREASITIIAPNQDKDIRFEYKNYQKIDYEKIVDLSQLGTYQIQYKGKYEWLVTVQGSFLREYSFSYYVSAIENHLPLKPWTITEVINRTLDLAEPIRKGEKPRFKLNAVQAQLFDKILAPQFSFTKQTLRECLQEIGKVVHGEPRLKPSNVEFTFIQTQDFVNGKAYIGSNNLEPYNMNDEYFVFIGSKPYKLEIEIVADNANDDYYFVLSDKPDYNGELAVFSREDTDYYYEVSYDMFAAQEKSGIWTKPYILKTVSQVVDSYTAWLDSNAENLVNQLDKYSGVIVEPYRNGAKTVRTENLYVRIEEGTMLIPTQYPIYTVDKLEYVYVEDNKVKSVDITPWLFERSVYDTELSSYAEQYPYSKAYALWFSQGSKNIQGLNFKVDAAVAAVFKNYAITNILHQAISDSYNIPEYPTMAFRVTYTPFYNARVAQTKPNYKEFNRPAALIFNQQANIVESRYYGENLKGAVARIGNIDLSLTYRLYLISDIPQAGQMYDDNYYISAVSVEYLPTCILCTIGLSRDFNRLSAYIGINSEKRYSEVSQTQAVERNTLWREYIVVGDSEPYDSDSIIGSTMIEAIAATFTQEGDYKPLTSVAAWGQSYNGNDLNVVSLPVISSAFGNSISFSWTYEDNYSAGAISHYENVTNGAQGYFQNNYPYGDYYGRIYYYQFDLKTQGRLGGYATLTQIGLDLPMTTKPVASEGYVVAMGGVSYLLRKDNREVLQCNFQIDFVTNTDIIIGSALASYCPAVRGIDNKLAAKLYVFPTELNKFTDHIEAWEDVKLSELPSEDISVTVTRSGYFTVEAEKFPASGKSWAIVTAQTELPAEEVENEKGEQFAQTQTVGGDMLIGQNKEVTAGAEFPSVYFTRKREIFDRTVWKDNL